MRYLFILVLVAAAVLVLGQQKKATAPISPDRLKASNPSDLKLDPFCCLYGDDGNVLGCLKAHGATTHGKVPRIPRPRNGQCPVCGTMAPAFSWGKGIPANQHFADEAGFNFGPSKGWQIRICAHCNTAFRQWAEGKEPKR